MITENKETKILKLHADGFTNREIVRQTKSSIVTVSKYLKKHGLFSNYKGKSINIVNDTTALCSLCEELMPLSGFSIIRKLDDKIIRTSYCSNCRNKKQKFQRNKSKEAYLKYRATHLRGFAKKHELPFNIDGEYLLEIYNLQNGKCFYSGLELKTEENKMNNRTLSLSVDRVIPEKGYTKGNIVLCTKKTNTIKHNQTLDELKEWMPSWYQKLTEADFVTVV